MGYLHEIAVHRPPPWLQGEGITEKVQMRPKEEKNATKCVKRVGPVKGKEKRAEKALRGLMIKNFGSAGRESAGAKQGAPVMKSGYLRRSAAGR